MDALVLIATVMLVGGLVVMIVALALLAVRNRKERTQQGRSPHSEHPHPGTRPPHPR